MDPTRSPVVPTRSPMITGRDDELRTLTGLIAATPRHGGAAVILGEAGIGKSSLLAAAAQRARARGLRVLETAGAESEARLPFAGLHCLLRPLRDAADTLSSERLGALLAAFGARDGPAPEPVHVAMAALDLLSGAAAQCPIVIAVDDVQWLDQPSQDALAFVARRVSSDPILVLGAVRSGHRGPFPAAGLPEIGLRALDDASSRDLLSAHADHLHPAEQERILRLSRGNPLALVELPTVWRRGHETGHDPAAGPGFVPLTARLEDAFARRAAELPAATRNAVLAAALVDPGLDDPGEVSRVLAAASLPTGRDLDLGVLEPAAALGLLRFDETRVTFRHPLVCCAVIQAEPETHRRAAHAALAATLDDPCRRAWHRAHATVGPDDEVADELEAGHATALRRGDAAAALWALERSAQLTGDPARRGRRLLLAAEHAFGLGRPDLVERLLAAAARTPLAEPDRARREWLREIFTDGAPGDATRVLELCADARRAAAADEPALALNLLLGAALRCWWADTGPSARARVVQAAEELRCDPDDPRLLAVLAVAEPVLRGRTVIERLSRIVVEDVADADALRLLGMAAHAVGDQVRAADFLERAETGLRAQGRVGLVSHVYGTQSRVYLDLGRFDRAGAAAAAARSAGRESGQPVWSAGQVVDDAAAAGLRGETEQALRLAAETDLSATLHHLDGFLARARLARGCAWTGAGRFAEAYEVLRSLFDPTEPGYHQRECFSGVMYLAEAAAHADRRDDARGVIAGMERVAAITPSPLLRMHLLYARAVLADDADAERLYTAALDEEGIMDWPWIRARLELAYGGWLRRRRRVVASRRPLRSALTVFDLIGARAWAEQARRELRAAGERAPRRRSTVQDMLSAQELQIARLAAEGLSNRQIAERLFLSHRTVGSHLYRIFPKLDITSRAQLAARLETD
jgi:DNA-binding CsgD family transcriptional regulator